MSRTSPPSHSHYTDENNSHRALYSPNPALIGAPPSRYRHHISFSEAGVGGKVLRAVVVLLVVGFNVGLVWALGWWGGVW